MFKKLALVAVIAMIPAAALAHYHTAQERDNTIAFCVKNIDNNTINTIVPRMRDMNIDPEQIDYTLDICMAYLQGYGAGLSKAH